VKELLGKKIVEIRHLTTDEMDEYGWEGEEPAVALVLDDGTLLFSSRDEEANGPGVIFGKEPDGGVFTLVLRLLKPTNT
jgi:hypothetical protein